MGYESLTGAKTNETRQKSVHLKSNRVDQRSFDPVRGKKASGRAKSVIIVRFFLIGSQLALQVNFFISPPRSEPKLR